MPDVPPLTDRTDDPSRAPAVDQDPEVEQYWRDLLTGRAQLEPLSRVGRALFRHLPSEPRCKWCYAPYGRPFGPFVRRLGYGPWEDNPSLCGKCMDAMRKTQGGAEVDLAVMFADLRGSTQIAARMKPGEYRNLLNVFYGIVAAAVQGSGGIVDKYLGDGVLALFIRGFVDGEAADVAVTAARRIMDQVADHPDLPPGERPLPVGIGVHLGEAYVGIVGQPGQPTDFTALGDVVNVAERISSSAAAAELLVSDAAASQLGQPLERAEQRQLELKGVAGPVAAWSVRATAAGGPAERR